MLYNAGKAERESMIPKQLTVTDTSIKKFLLYLIIITGVVGAAFLAVDIGPFSLFPYRIFLLLLWMSFLMGIVINQGRVNISHIKAKLYLQFLAFWVLYALLSLTWAASKVDAIRHIIFLSMGVSLIFFVAFYFTDLKDLKGFYNLWLLILLALIPIGIWETITGHHLSVSRLVQTQHPVVRFIPTTVFRNPNDFATYLALSFPFVLAFIRYNSKLIRRLLGITMLVAALYLVVSTLSRANYLAVLMGAAFWFFFLLRVRAKLKAMVLTGLVTLLLLVTFPGGVQDISRTASVQLGSLIAGMPQLAQDSLGIRFNLVRNSLVFLGDHFGFGVGAGNVEYHMANFQVYDTQGIINPHNWWIEILTEYGILIFVSYVALYLGLLIGLYKVYNRVTEASEKMICEALLVGLVVFFFASMSSSSIIALKPQWIFFAFALGFLNYYRLKQVERSK